MHRTMSRCPGSCAAARVAREFPNRFEAPAQMAAVNNDESPHVKLTAAMVTDVGVVRDHNEDSAFVDGGSQFFIVADGMGGHAAGEVASAMAVETVRKTLEASRARVTSFARKPSEEGRRELVQLLQR